MDEKTVEQETKQPTANETPIVSQETPFRSFQTQEEFDKFCAGIRKSAEDRAKSSMKIKADGILRLSSNGAWSKIQGQYDKSMFLDIVNMNFKKVNSIFDIDLSGSAKNWIMNLKPKRNIAGKIFKNIIIKGGVFVSSIEIIEENGDKTIMKFFNVSSREK